MKRVWFSGMVLALAFGVNAGAVTIADIQSTGGTGINACPAPYTAIGCIRFGDKVFQGIEVTGLAAGDVNVSGSQIGNTVFIDFTGAFFDTNPAAGATDYTLKYNVTSLAGLTIGGIAQILGGDFGTAGFLDFKEKVYADASFLTRVAQSELRCDFPEGALGCLDDSDPNPEIIQGDNLVIAAPLQTAYVFKDLLVFASEDRGSVGASFIRQGFVQVPEPGQAALLLGGLLAIGLYFKSRKRAAA